MMMMPGTRLEPHERLHVTTMVAGLLRHTERCSGGGWSVDMAAVMRAIGWQRHRIPDVRRFYERDEGVRLLGTELNEPITGAFVTRSSFYLDVGFSQQQRLKLAAARVNELASAAQMQVHVEVIDGSYFDGEVRVDFEWSISWDAEQGNEEAWSLYRVVQRAGTRWVPPEEEFVERSVGCRLDTIVADALVQVVRDRIEDFCEREQERDEEED